MSSRIGTSVLSVLVILSLLLAACQPIQPAPAEGAEPAPLATPAAAAEGTDALAGEWSGSIAIAGAELGIEVTFAAEGDGYTAAMNIPQQGATGLPVHSIVFAPPALSFAILEGAQQATFDGVLEDGAISGAFLQAGQEGTFSLARASAATPSAAPEGSGIAETYSDPNGFFTVPVPTNWIVKEFPGYVLLTDPEGDMKAYLLAIPTDDPEAAVATAWKTVNPEFASEVRESYTPPSGEGIERTVLIDYKADEGSYIQGMAQLLDGISYVELYEGTLEGIQRRGSQLQIISSGFKILALEKVDLNAQEPGALTDEVIAQLEDFIAHAMEVQGIPGAAVGIVRDGELVYAKGFGYADPATETPMTPQTQMMIGSTGKSMTTMMMATLVDDGLMTWDTPAQQLYPSFAVKDPELSKTITMRNLVCACTGVPRRDFELLFNADDLDAADIIASLADFEFFTGFGEAFQYSNQMVAAAGYIAGSVAEPGAASLEEAYTTAMVDRVTGPIGMENTTLAVEDVLARDLYATPHGAAIDGTYVPIDLRIEQMLRPVNPSGGYWSTLEDMAKYMMTQLSTGVAPDGTRVVSEENLLVTRQPQVKINAQSSYGLGWMLSSYKGLPVVTHGGNTLGFSTDFNFLPTVDLGMIVLANAQGANLMGNNAFVRLLELLYGLESEVLPSYDFVEEQIAKGKQELAAMLATELDTAAVEPFVGSYTSTALGPLLLTLEEGKLFADAGEFRTELLPKLDDDGQPDGYLMADPPLAGLAIKLEKAADGTRQVVLGEGLTEYVFVPAP